MCLSDVIVTGALSVFLASGIFSEMKGFISINAKANEVQQKAECLKYVSESFRNTCNGLGYESLDEWKKECRKMWNLDYISYEIRDNRNADGITVFHGIWTGPYGKGEAYQRKPDNETTDF